MAWRKEVAGEEDERAEKENRGTLRLCASSSETRRSIWWSATLRMAVWSLFRRSAAFWKIVYMVRNLTVWNAECVWYGEPRLPLG